MVRLFENLKAHPSLVYHLALAVVNYLMVALALLWLLTGYRSNSIWLFLGASSFSSLWATGLLWEHRPHRRGWPGAQ